MVRVVTGLGLLIPALLIGFWGVSLIFSESEDTSQATFYIVGGLGVILGASLGAAGVLLVIGDRIAGRRWPPLLAAPLFVGLVATFVLSRLVT